jgi:hypothetical protein
VSGGFWQGLFLGLATGVAGLGVFVSWKLECVRRDHAAERLERSLTRWKGGRR